MKKLLLSYILGNFLLLSCSDSSDILENPENIKKVEKGMRIEVVNQIMGKPYSVEDVPLWPDYFRHSYVAPSGLSDNYHVYFLRNDSTVSSISYGL